ncbi:MAG: DUF4126 domain-containing protein [Tannerella sp.]|jgi:large-conductance mechanosensitive channel|nr:DUF4126 domain-containing protein [Tannerella sp.]
MLQFFQDTPVLQYVLAAFIGIGLAAATGLRVFLPMFAVSLASYFHWIPVSESFEWLAGLPALIITGIATVVEILAYYIPFIDNLLDSITVPMATIAGAILFAAQFTDLETFPQWALALIAGGGTAAIVSSTMAGARALSSTTTVGVANPVVSTIETTGAVVMTAFSYIFPVIAFVLAVVFIVLIIRIRKKIRKRRAERKNKADNPPSPF